MNLPIVSLIATKPRIAMLEGFACPSLQQQSKQPDLVVIVADQRCLRPQEIRQIQAQIPVTETVFLKNPYTAGAAASWNEGFRYIASRYPDCYVAILDDDDMWHKHHLKTCAAASEESTADIVLSGIEIKNGSEVIQTHIPHNITAADFLTGNPGWQGSNTFIRLKKVLDAGGFRQGLVSCNDRDLAIRVLDTNPNIAYTGLTTVTWNLNLSIDALSAVGSPQKLKGAAHFYQLYQDRMTTLQRELFFFRMEKLFKLDKKQIIKQSNCESVYDKN